MVGQVVDHCPGEHIDGGPEGETESMLVRPAETMVTIIAGYLLARQVSDLGGPGELVGEHVGTVRVVLVGHTVDELVVPVTADVTVVGIAAMAPTTTTTLGRTMVVLGWRMTVEWWKVVRGVGGHEGSEHTFVEFVVPVPVSCSPPR